jgi:hypothetical protein
MLCGVRAAQEPGKATYGMTAFNMQDEKDEGHFDENGNFVWNAEDKKVQEEAWLEDISEEQMDAALNAKVRGVGYSRNRHHRVDNNVTVVSVLTEPARVPR